MRPAIRTVVVAGLMVGAFFGKVGEDFSRVWIATWFATALFALFGERLLVSWLVRHWIREGRLNRRAVIVGGGAEAEALIKALEASRDTDIRIAGIFDDTVFRRSSPATPSSATSTSFSTSRAIRASTFLSSRCQSPPRSACCNS